MSSLIPSWVKKITTNFIGNPHKTNSVPAHSGAPSRKRRRAASLSKENLKAEEDERRVKRGKELNAESEANFHKKRTREIVEELKRIDKISQREAASRGLAQEWGQWRLKQGPYFTNGGSRRNKTRRK